MATESANPGDKFLAKAKKLALPIRGNENSPLLDRVARGTVRFRKQHRGQKTFFRLLRKSATSAESLRMLLRLRDSIIRSTLKREDSGTGLTVAVAGIRGGEGASFLSLLLALSLGASKHHRVAFLDGRFDANRFEALSEFLSLSQDSCCMPKGSSEVIGYINEFQPNVYFLNSPDGHRSLDFFSDKELEIFLANLQQNFDFSIIDMPPFLSESANVFVAPAVDRLFLVVSAGSTRLADVDECIGIAEDAGVEIAGVILNHQKAPFWSRLFWREYFF